MPERRDRSSRAPPRPGGRARASCRRRAISSGGARQRRRTAIASVELVRLCRLQDRHAPTLRTAAARDAAAARRWTCSAAQLGAAMQLGNTLPGLSRPLGVEGAFQALLLRQIDLVEHHAASGRASRRRRHARRSARRRPRRRAAGCRRRIPRRARARRACWRRRGSADGDCRRRRGRRWRRAARSRSDSFAIAASTCGSSRRGMVPSMQ